MTKHDRNLNLPVVQVADTQVQQIAYKGAPVVTFAMVDEIHQRADGTARRNFNDNRERFEDGRDFVKISANEIRTHKIMSISDKAHGDVVLLTERGYLKLVKPMQDDRAWEVQGDMIDCYFKVKEGKVIPAPAPDSVALSREVRLQQRMFARIAKDAGLTGNQALLSVCKGVETMTGVNPMAAMGISRLEAEQNDDLLNVGDLGHLIGVKAQEMNLKLIGRGLQTAYRDRKGNKKYELTEEGKALGGVWTDVQKAQGGRPIRQLMWRASVADLFRGEASA